LLLSPAFLLVMRFSEFLLSLSRLRKQVILMAADGLMLSAALFGALVVNSGGNAPIDVAYFAWLTGVLVFIAFLIFARLGLYRTVIRYLSETAFLRVVEAVLLSAVVLAALIPIGGFRGVSMTVPIVYCLIALLLVCGSRLAVRICFRTVAGHAKKTKNVVIYGAGDCGVQLARALAFSAEYRPVAFVDDDARLQRRLVLGLPVFAPGHLGKLIPKLTLSQVLLAMPCISPVRHAEILASLDALPIHVRTVPSLSDLVSGAASLRDTREIDIEDMLGRKAVGQDGRLLDACVRDKIVMVTGAGGSIGSQICRHILRLGAKQLILFEQSEFLLYQIEKELLATLPQEEARVRLVALLGSIQDRARVENAMRGFNVESVFHAAAYKHVPMVEYNIMEGARNNVLGSWQVATAATAAGVQTCVLVSTDKAVRPSSVMGASKRFAELIFQAMATNERGPRFCIVRLGNVIGSSGSVIPLFREQLRRGGPLTVTHPDAKRYFMSVSDAADLIIQAGSMAVGGEIFVLDMGEPVRIVDLAKKMVRFAGLTIETPDHPDGDIKIEYIGLRPGEKLVEELFIGNCVEPTAHPRILCAREACLSRGQVRFILRLLSKLCAQHDCEGVRQIFMYAVDGYQPDRPLIDRLWEQRLESSRGTVAHPAGKVLSIANGDCVSEGRHEDAVRRAGASMRRTARWMSEGGVATVGQPSSAEG
jgi:FlaA1/EpsC-like NDP-sugar epimerase